MAVPAGFSDLMEISSQVEAAIVLEGGEIAASSIPDVRRSQEFAGAIRRLIDAAEKTRPAARQIEVVVPEGNVFVVREGSRVIAATTASDPPSGLVFYDLGTCLSGLGADKEASDAAR